LILLNQLYSSGHILSTETMIGNDMGVAILTQNFNAGFTACLENVHMLGKVVVRVNPKGQSTLPEYSHHLTPNKPNWLGYLGQILQIFIHSDEK
jgi:hypothetical protein